MSKINELNITISKAVITSISVELGDDGAEWSVHGKLLTKENKEISTFHFESNPFNDDRKITIPLSMDVWARNMFEELTPVIYEKINGKFKALPEGKK